MLSKLGSHTNNDKNTLFLLFMIPIFLTSLLTGPFIPDLFVVLISVGFIFLYLTKYKDKIEVNLFIKFIFIFYFYIVINSFFSYEKYLSLKSSIPFFRFIIFIIAISYLLQSKKYKYIIYYSFLSIYILLFFDSLFQLFTGANVFGFKLINDRVSSFFGDELILGSFVSKTIVIPLYLIFNLKIKYKLIHYLSIITISLVLVTISAERTSLFILFIIIFSSLFYLKINQVIYFLVIIIFAISSAFILHDKSYQRLVDHTFNQIVSDGKFNYPSYRHQLHYLSAWKIFQDNKIFGSGIKTFRVLCDDEIYNLENKLKKEHVKKSNYDGIILFGKYDESQNWIRIFDNNQLNNPRFHRLMVFKFGKLDNYQNSLATYGKLNPSTIYNNSNFFISYVQNFEKIKINQELYSLYEFKNGCNTHPHNFYIQFLAELGIIGFLFLAGIYLFIIFKILKILFYRYKKKKLSPNFILYCSFFAVLFPLIPSGNLFNNYLSLLIFLPLCMFKLCYTK